MAKAKTIKQTGVVVPLGALYTRENTVIGEFPDLVPFAQFCKEAGLSIIQLLPVNDTGTQSSPYSGLSAFALHPIYIRLKDIPSFNELYETDEKFKRLYDTLENTNPYTLRYDYDEIQNKKLPLLLHIYSSTPTGKTGVPDEALAKFIKANSWIKNYAVYKALKWNYLQASWKSWIDSDKNKTQEEIEKLWNTKAFQKEHLFYAWCQMIASQQFEKAVNAVHEMGILLKGDMPILMNEDSCDAWAYPQYFNQELRAGSPADGENPAGQNWGFPTYNWKNLANNNYSWWKERLKCANHYYDAYRLDHILGFFRIWAIPETDCNALTGHTEPFSSFKKDDLYKIGFDDDRIRWLSQPHVPTHIVEDITWNHETAHKILSLLCDQIGTEELWLFKKTVSGSQAIWNTSFEPLCEKEAEQKIKEKLVEYWSNRTLLEVSKNKFVPLWTYGNSTSWSSLNETEKKSLSELFETVDKKNEKLWKKQADDIFTAITSNLKMIPCGEDLGVSIKCVQQTMQEHQILGLKVVRWCRKWSEQNQPYVPFEDYDSLSVTTTSVHDSSTIRQWYEDEMKNAGENKTPLEELLNIKERSPFTPELAYQILKNSAETQSMWYINPLQDYLYMNQKYWLEDACDERINVPGTVTKFNWTYRMPVSIEELSEDKELIEKIKKISERR